MHWSMLKNRYFCALDTTKEIYSMSFWILPKSKEAIPKEPFEIFWARVFLKEAFKQPKMVLANIYILVMYEGNPRWL